jgi:hypothetical protein
MGALLVAFFTVARMVRVGSLTGPGQLPTGRFYVHVRDDANEEAGHRAAKQLAQGKRTVHAFGVGIGQLASSRHAP